MKIIVDAMGGDNAPEAIVKGSVYARDRLGAEIVLVGRKEEIEKYLGEDRNNIEIVDVRDIITMEDDPSTATRRKKDSSMTVALTMLKNGEGDAMVSAGSTGALLTGATLIVKRIKGVRRAAMAPVLPSRENGIMLIDCGANAECTPEYLLQFAYMGSFYARRMMDSSISARRRQRAARFSTKRISCSKRRAKRAGSILSAMSRAARCCSAALTLS